MSILLKNGKAVIDGQILAYDIRYDENSILEVGAGLPALDSEVRDITGLTVLPGLVDVHVHLREPGREEKETIRTGTRAAARGGFTTIFAMPNVLPFPSSRPVMEAYQELIERESVIRTIPYGTITIDEAGQQPVDYEAMKKAGIRWFSDDGTGIANTAIMHQALTSNAQADILFACHTEDMDYRKPGASVHDSPVNRARGWIGIPSACETAQLVRDIEILKETGGRYHVCHVSAKESVEAIRAAKEDGLDITGEVSAHHLLLEDRDVQSPNWKMNPPLRCHADRMALIEGLESGILDMIANDHAPHTEAEKNQSMDKAPFGIVSLETAFVLLYTEFVSKGRWSLPQLVHWMSAAPARRYGLKDTGTITPGARADLVLLNEHAPCTIDKNEFLSKGRNTPFDGWQVDCTITETICEGKTVWKGN